MIYTCPACASRVIDLSQKFCGNCGLRHLGVDLNHECYSLCDCKFDEQSLHWMKTKQWIPKPILRNYRKYKLSKKNRKQINASAVTIPIMGIVGPLLAAKLIDKVTDGQLNKILRKFTRFRL